jgi:hypothetical protein
MNREHVISDELLDQARFSFAKNEHWVAYNTVPYFLDKGDMYFFKTADEAHEFSDNNISEYDDYRVLHAYSLDELLKRIPYGELLENKILNSNLSIMNDKNFEYLKDNIKYLGFGEKQHEALEAHLKEGKESFQLNYSAEVNKKPFEAVLNFRRSDSSDMYFLNSYQARLERNNGDKMEQTFYLNKGKGVTAKEAYNLLEGRAVYKELNNKAGEPYKAWIQLDFEQKDKNNNYEVNQYHEKYGYDLKAAVGKYFIMEMDGGEKEKALLQSLQKGNIQAVNISVDGESQKMFIEANPQYKTINLYNDKMQRLSQEQRSDMSQKQTGEGLKQEKEQDQQGLKQDNKKTEKQKPEKEDSLLPKKRVRQKKGLKI